MQTHPRIEQHLAKDLLRFVIAGSVDDGKSSLLGRLLFDAGGLFEDQIADATVAMPDGSRTLDLSRVTDGLIAEREQQITMDVAYRYFTTDRRKFIVADTPGHLQYTRNMVTGASTADAALLLVDAARGPTTQTRRHAFIAARLGLRELIVCINKMDLVGWSRERFDALTAELAPMLAEAGFAAPRIVPVSATLGDNVVRPSPHLPWAAQTLLDLLHALPPASVPHDGAARLWVQTVLRSADGGRYLAGRLRGGALRVGETVALLPSGAQPTIAELLVAGVAAQTAAPGESVAVRLDRDLDCGRGDLLTTAGSEPPLATSFEADLVWFDSAPLRAGRQLRLKMGTRETRVSVSSLQARTDLDTLTEERCDALVANDLGVGLLRAATPLPLEPYAIQSETGALILLDAHTFATVGAGMVRRTTTDAQPAGAPTPRERSARLGHCPLLVHLPEGQPPKATAALERRLFSQGLTTATAGDEATARALLHAGLVVLSEVGVGDAWPTADLRGLAPDQWEEALDGPLAAIRED